MIKLYSFPNQSSSRKARAWLHDAGVTFKEISLRSNRLTRRELLHIFSLTEGGTEELIAKRSSLYSIFEEKFDQFTVEELIVFIQDNPTLLRSPLIVDEHRLQVGFNDQDIRQFIPRQSRRFLLNAYIQEVWLEEVLEKRVSSI